MEILQAYRFELRPDGEQQSKLRSFAGSCRFVWNKALALQKERYEQGEKKLSYAGLCRGLTVWRHDAETPWLGETHVAPQQQTLKDLEKAYANFFAKRAAFPRFKKKGRGDSFRYPDPGQFKVEQGNSRVFLPKIGWVRYRNSRPMDGEYRNITVSEACGRWYVSIQTRRVVKEPVHPSVSEVGIDMGVARFATLSNGTVVEPLGAHKKHARKLARAQRRLARKRKFSANWKKQKAKVSRIQQKIAACRKDFLHKASTTISKNHAVVYIEDLQVSNMTTSARGTAEKPGRNVRQKSGLNRSILDQGWHEFRRQLEYKEAWRGGCVVAVPPAYTSQTCLCCGHVSSENRTTQAVFACIVCGYTENADLVGALNVLARGHRVTACGGYGEGRPVKQEPAEASECLCSDAVGIPPALAAGRMSNALCFR